MVGSGDVVYQYTNFIKSRVRRFATKNIPPPVILNEVKDLI